MVKFFMPHTAGDSKEIHRKQTANYRVAVFNEIQPVFKHKKLESINMTVRKIKELHQSAQINLQQLKDLEDRLSVYKSVSKQDINSMTLQAMNQHLHINNFSPLTHALFNAGHLIAQDGTLTPSHLSSAKIEMMNEVMGSKWFLSKVEKVGHLITGIANRKNILKQKTKQRKIRKLEVRKVKRCQEIQANSGDQDLKVSPDQADEASREQLKLTHQNPRIQLNHSKEEFNQNTHQHSSPNALGKKRTQFIKKGRNKRNQHQKGMKNEVKSVQESGYTNRLESKQVNPTRQDIHPSLKAKLDQRKQMYITKFEGKKTML